MTRAAKIRRMLERIWHERDCNHPLHLNGVMTYGDRYREQLARGIPPSEPYMQDLAKHDPDEWFTTRGKKVPPVPRFKIEWPE